MISIIKTKILHDYNSVVNIICIEAVVLMHENIK